MTSAATTAAGTSGAAGFQASTSESFTYNDRGGLLTAAGSAGSSSFGYNTDGLMTSRTDAAGTSAYGYDTADRLSTMTDAATGVQQGISYNTLNQVSKVQYGTSGNVRTFGYDDSHRLAGDTLKSNANAVIASITYGYDLNGNVTSKTTAGFAGASVNTYGYDLSNRVTSWTNGAAVTSYGYDASGNRTQIGANVYTYDARDQLTSDGVNTYTYTARGTLRQRVSSSAGSFSVLSDAFGQMSVQGSQSYGYDALARNLTDTATPAAGGAVTTFAFSGQGNTAASDGVNTYSRDPGGNVSGIGVAASGGGTVAGSGVFAFTDQHSDVVGDFTATGAVLSGSTSFDPLGNVTATTNQSGKLGFQSGWTDKATGNVNMAARWYNPAIGQFMSRDSVSNDPVPNSAEANPFAYVDDNPVLGQDPSGHGWFSDFVSAGASWVNQHVIQPVEHVAVAAYHWADEHIVQPVVHVVQVVAHRVVDAYRRVVRVVRTVYHRVVRAVRRVVRAAVHVVRSAYHAVAKVVKSAAHAVASAAKAVGNFAKEHAATIASVAVGIGAFAGCMAVTGGVGSIGCAALAGAAANAVSYGMSCGKSQGGCSAGGAIEAVGMGAAAGALGGALAGPLGGKLVASALDGVLPEAAVQGLVGAGSGAVTGGAMGAADYGLHCGGSAAGCSAGGAASAAKEGAVTGAVLGGVLGAVGGLRSKAPGCRTHSFTGGTGVLLADGAAKPISSVRVGDRVANSVPGDKTLQVHTVDRVIETTTDHDFVDVTVKPGATSRVKAAVVKAAVVKAVAGAALAVAALTAGAGVANATPAETPVASASTVSTTFHHPFYDITQASFVDAVDLHPGDELQTTDGDTATITAVRPYHTTEVTYDLTINGLHTYYVMAGITPILVHNCNLYRSDTREPSEIFDVGFKSKGGNMNLDEHVAGVAGVYTPESGYVSTSTSEAHAIGRGGNVYAISGVNTGTDVNEAIPGNVHSDESEIAVPHGIDSSCIVGCRLRDGTWVPNPNFGR
jgi:RHS repeat-associated protein